MTLGKTNQFCFCPTISPRTLSPGRYLKVVVMEAGRTNRTKRIALIRAVYRALFIVVSICTAMTIRFGAALCLQLSGSPART